MSARTEVFGALKTALADEPWAWVDHDESLTPTKTTVMVWDDQVTNGATLGQRAHQIVVLVIVPFQTGGQDDLEAALGEVLGVMDNWPVNAVWTTAEFLIYGGSWPAYKVTVPCTTVTVYPPEEG